ncbi:MAG: Spy/CpxP family protein refolding chaperone [Nitrospirota bacterium]|nr:Spy/CpxP family protein refolding chaperone [Nitrospirota bacterium]
MKTLRPLSAALAVACTLALAAPALAGHDDNTPDSYGRKMARTCGGSGLYWIKGLDEVAAHYAALTDAQKKAWEKLRADARAARDEVQASCDKMRKDRENLSSPERLDLMTKMAETRTAAMRRIAPSFTAFYNTLNQAQKGGVDDEFMQPRMNRGGMRGGMQGGMQGGMPQGMPNMQGGMPQGMPNMQGGMPQGMPNMQGGMPQGMPGPGFDPFDDDF